MRYNNRAFTDAQILTTLVAADGASGGFVKDSEVSTFARTFLDDADGREVAKTLGGWKVLAAGGATISSTNTVSEEALLTIAIPAGAMGPNGILRLTLTGVATNNANVKTVTMRLGASGAGLGGTSLSAIAVTSSATWVLQRTIHNKNAQNSQETFANSATAFNTNTGGIATAAIDTSAAAELVVSSTKATGTDALSIRGYVAELYYGA